MKIIAVDIKNHDDVADLLVCENINDHFGDVIVEFLNNAKDSLRFYRLVEDDYVLFRGKEEITN